MKVFKSIVWEGQLEEYASKFVDHRENLQHDLAMHASLTIDSLGQNVNVMLLLRQLQSPVERDLAKFIHDNGGPEAFLQDDRLWEELRKRAPPDELDASRSELQKELTADVKEIIKAREDVFIRKFEAKQVSLLDEMDTRMVREGDRIIKALGGATYERLIDPVSYSASRVLNSD